MEERAPSFGGKGLFAVVGLLLVTLSVCAFSSGAQVAAEEFSLAFAPNASRAYGYANSHLDARFEEDYDIDRAEYLYRQALSLDPSLPYVRHQLARIAFLRGDMRSAIVLINQELVVNPQPSPSTYYIRGLIRGYSGDYDAAVHDYERYLKSDPHNWAAINDLAWVLLKAGNAQKALDVTAKALAYFPGNAWLLNSHTIALYETGRYDIARVSAQAAMQAYEDITQEDWVVAYPGNDPRVAEAGMKSLRYALERNMHMVASEQSKGAVE